MTARRICAFTTAFVLSAGVAYSVRAHAAWTRHAVTNCSSDDTTATFADAVSVRAAARSNVYCAVPDTEEREAHRSGGVNVWVDDASPRDVVSLSLCGAVPDVDFAFCTVTQATTTAADVKRVLLSGAASAWAQTPSNFKFLAVALPGVHQGKSSRLLGFTTF